MEFYLTSPAKDPYIVIAKFGHEMTYGPHRGWDFTKLLDPSKPAYRSNINNDWLVVYPCEGRITESKWSTSGGNILTIDAGNGFKVWLAHFKKTFQPVGTIVKRGASAGNAGTTPGLPWSDYVHSHLQLYKNGVVIDPAPYFRTNDEITMDYQNSIIRNIDTGGFFFFKGTQKYKMARQPLTSKTVGYASLTLTQIWKDQDYAHIYQMNTEEIKKYAVVWKFFPEDSNYIKNYKE